MYGNAILLPVGVLGRTSERADLKNIGAHRCTRNGYRSGPPDFAKRVERLVAHCMLIEEGEK